VRQTLRHRRALVWLCLVATLWLGFLTQQHALSHALNTLHSAPPHDALAGHTQACEQCLQLAAATAAPPAVGVAWLPPVASGLVVDTIRLPWRTEAFSAYVSRAPPRV
jgi:hypothetical protein